MFQNLFHIFATLRQILIIVILLAVGAAVYSQPCERILTGHIQDADTRENLEGATVTIKELQSTSITDSRGDFKYTRICDGTYTIHVTHVGCAPYSQTVVVTRNMHLDILLPHLRNNLNEVVVAGSRQPPATGYRQQVSQQELEASRAFSLADALGKINGINILQTGSNISKPVIHGLHSIRVLTINNGVRQEGQQWGAEHAPEIDPYIADKISVIKGVDELRYGSDAIGGVVLVDPRPIRSLPGVSGEINTAFFSNNGQYLGSAFLEQQFKKLSSLSYRVQGTFKKGGNIKTPGYRLNNTGIEETNFSIAGNWKKKHYNLQVFYSEFNTTLGLFPFSSVGNLTDLLQRIDQPRPSDVFLNEKTRDIDRPRQEVLHRLLKLKSGFTIREHKFNITLAGQYNHRSEYDVVRNASLKGPQIALALSTFSEELTWEHPVLGNFSGTAGISLSQQDNTYSGRYLIPNYTSQSWGAFLIEKWSRNDWELSGGLRFDKKTIDTRRLRYGGQITDNEFDFSTLAASFNTNYRISNSLKTNAGITLSSRAPQVNELLSGGIHQGSGGYSFLQGNINLKTEKSVNIAAGFAYNRNNLTAEISVYRNPINDFIYTQPKPGEPVLTITGAAPKIEYQQTDAVLTGADLSAGYRFFEHLQLDSKLSILRARNLSDNDWLILMPADRWRNELAWHFGKDRYVSAEYIHVFKPRVPDDTNGKQDYKSPPGAYSLLNFNAAATINIFQVPVSFGLTIRNSLDTKYRDYMNLFRYYADETGRNIILRLKIPFSNN